MTEEVYLAAARQGAIQFTPGQMFTGTGIAGQIAKIESNGTSTIPWVTLPGETGLLRGALHIDTTGLWGGDLIVATTTGNVWRINSAGAATFLANTGPSPVTTNNGPLLEGIITVPNDARYDPWAGKILTGSVLLGIGLAGLAAAGARRKRRNRKG